MKTLFFLLIATACQAQSGSFSLKAIEYKPDTTLWHWKQPTVYGVLFSPDLPDSTHYTIKEICELYGWTYDNLQELKGTAYSMRRYGCGHSRCVEVGFRYYGKTEEFTVEEFLKLIKP